MNHKTIAAIVVVLIVLTAAYFLSRPASDKKVVPNGAVENTGQPPQADPPKSKTIPLAEAAYQEFINWKKEAAPSPKERDARLHDLSEKFPKDFRFPLERIRGAANIKGVHSHKEAFELLSTAAEKAIACECGDAEKMLADLRAHEGDKANGFWKLSTHPKQWDTVVEALEHGDIGGLNTVGGHH